jgi:hypothetical protein
MPARNLEQRLRSNVTRSNYEKRWRSKVNAQKELKTG